MTTRLNTPAAPRLSRLALRATASAAALLAPVLAPQALAQDAALVTLDTITVTGERRERALEEVYVGASVIPEDEIARNPQSHLNDLLIQTPNVFVEGKSEVPSLRGVQGGGPGGLNSIGLTGALPRLNIVIDGVSRPAGLPNTSGGSLWDVDQVEVLRGPQSLLRGRSAFAGAVIVDTRDPTFELEAAAQAGVEIDEFHGPEGTFNAMVNAPLSDALAARATLELSGGQDARHATDVPDDWITEYTDIRGRAKLRGEVDTSLGFVTVNLLGEHQRARTPQTRNNVQGPALTGRPLADRILVNALSGPRGIPARTFDTQATTVSVDTALDTGTLTLRSITSYTSDAYESIPEQVFPSRFDIDEEIFTQDILVEFGPGERVRAREFSGLLGLSFEERWQNTRIDDLFTYDSAVRGSSQSVFADLRFGLTDALTLFGGARLQRYHDERAQTSRFGPSVGTQDFDQTDILFLPGIGLAYHVTDADVVSASVRRGFNPGGSAVNIFTGLPYTYDNETVTTLETTYRHIAEDGRLSFGATAFLNFFEDPQLYAELVPGNRATLQVINQDAGLSYGVEFDARWRATDRLDLTGSLGFLKTEITEANAATPAIEGNSFGQDPWMTASLGAVFALTDFLSIDGRVTYRGESYNDFNNVAGDEVGDYVLVDVGATANYRNIEVRGYVKNLFNQTGVTRYVSNKAYADVTEPLTAGLTLTARW